MRTLGVDLSASPKKTAACLLVWKGGQAAAEELFSGLDDQAIVDRMAAAHWTRIDAPFGWPADYIEAITQWATEGAWPEGGRDRLRLRETDRFDPVPSLGRFVSARKCRLLEHRAPQIQAGRRHA